MFLGTIIWDETYVYGKYDGLYIFLFYIIIIIIIIIIVYDGKCDNFGALEINDGNFNQPTNEK